MDRSTRGRGVPAPPGNPVSAAGSVIRPADRTTTWAGFGPVLRVLRMALAHPVRLTVAVTATVAAAVFQLLLPQYVGDVVDTVNVILAGATDPSAAKRQLLKLAALILGASVVRGLMMMVHTQQAEIVGQSVGYRLRMNYYDKVQRLSYGFHDRVHTGELITRGMLDVESVATSFNRGMIKAVWLLVLLGWGTWLLLSTDPLLTLAAMSFAPVVAWRATVARMRLRVAWLRLQQCLARLTKVMEENLGGIRVVRAFAAREHEMGKFDTVTEQAKRYTDRTINIRVRDVSLMTLAYYSAMALMLWVGGTRVLAGHLTVGDVTEFLVFMLILQMPIRQLGMVVSALSRASTSGGRLFEILDLDPDIRDRPDAHDLEIREGVLRFESVSFSYGGDGDTVLDGISFEVGPGRTLGIVGPPGSGKSTIALLTARYYDVDAGRITIDGQDIRSVTLQSLRSAVGVIQQDNFLFTASVESNVAYADPWAQREQITHASSSAQLHDWVLGLPEEYRTLVGERGVSLSGGQRQRLSIARSIMVRPAVIAFDDSTAAIDAGTERRIRTALRKLTERTATIIVSHRLSSLMHADEILFVDAGSIVERGTHAELMELGGRYRALYQLQANPSESLDRIADSIAGGAARAGEVARGR
jgi:ATP-binding cassette subfamily B protein